MPVRRPKTTTLGSSISAPAASASARRSTATSASATSRPWNVSAAPKSRPRNWTARFWLALADRYWIEHGQHLAWRRTIKGTSNALADLIGDRTPARTITTDTFARGVAEWRLRLAPATVNHRLAVARSIWSTASDLWGIRLPVMPGAACGSRCPTSCRPTSHRRSARRSCSPRHHTSGWRSGSPWPPAGVAAASSAWTGRTSIGIVS